MLYHSSILTLSYSQYFNQQYNSPYAISTFREDHSIFTWGAVSYGGGQEFDKVNNLPVGGEQVCSNHGAFAVVDHAREVGPSCFAVLCYISLQPHPFLQSIAANVNEICK